MSTNQKTERAWTALADPTRRTIFERLLGGRRSVSELADGLPISRPAVSQHLKALSEADLVVAESEGTRRYYRPNARALARLHADVERFWQRALEAFDDRAEGGG